jgi:tetratricopeptide (TPR) repeat protein
MGGVGFLPLFGGPGYEHALASGLVVPSAAAIATAMDVSGDAPRSAEGGRRPEGQARPVEPSAAFGRAVASGLWLALVTLATAVLHGLRVGICEWWGALAAYALTAGAGAVLGGVWGALAGELGRRRKRRRLFCVLFALAGPIAGVVVSVARFVTSPMVFAFDPFVGYFSGTLYDTVIDPGIALYTYRFGTLCTLAFAGLFASSLERHWDGGLRGAPDARGKRWLAVLFGAASLGITFEGDALGHWSTTASIARDLGARMSGPRCEIVYPSTTRKDEAELALKDCEEQLASVEKVLGARGPERITAFFFRDAGDKKRLMGAADTYIAKPWRHEVYLQMAPYPHPVLGHELAHVVAGSFGRGPFRVAGAAGGIWPNPGLIEGVAVAASPDDEDLTDAQWARAMMDIGILPPMKHIFAMGFLGESSQKSYTLAGAFVSWLIETRGAALVRDWYAGGSIEALAGKSWDDLDAEFRRYLSALPLGAEATAYAKAKFGRPGVFGRKCPHVVDALRREADKCRDTQQAERAVKLYDDVLARDPTDYASLHGRALVWLRQSDAPRGESALGALASDDKTPRTWRDRAEEALADHELLEGKVDSAAARYHAIAARTQDEDAARTLEVKAIAAKDPVIRPAVTTLLVGTKIHPADLVAAAFELGAVQSRSPLAEYLIGRNLQQRGWWDEAARHLDAALAGDLPSPRVVREALRLRAICACARGDRAAAESVRARLDAAFTGSSGGRKASVERLIARCAAR